MTRNNFCYIHRYLENDPSVQASEETGEDQVQKEDTLVAKLVPIKGTHVQVKRLNFS